MSHHQSKLTVFVDTNYLLASISEQLGQEASVLNIRKVVWRLSEIVTERLGRPVFRQYWYDGIPDSGPTHKHRALSSIAGVTLREGDLVNWKDAKRQKAVDTRLVADMIVMTINGSVDEVVLVAGDLDLLPGVEEAMRIGTKVTLIGNSYGCKRSVSRKLESSVDQFYSLSLPDEFADCIKLLPVPRSATQDDPDDSEPTESIAEDAEVVESEADREPEAGEVTASRPTPMAMSPNISQSDLHFVDPDAAPDRPVYISPSIGSIRPLSATGIPAYDQRAHEVQGIGEEIGLDWYRLNKGNADLIKAILSEIGLPRLVDSYLLREGSDRLGINDLDEYDRKSLRYGFNEEVRHLIDQGEVR